MNRTQLSKILLPAVVAAQFFVSCGNKPTDGQSKTDTLPTGDTNQKNEVKKADIPQTLSVSEMAEADKKYKMPAPNLIFNSLGKIDKVNWSQQTNFSFGNSYPNDYSRSFVLGRAVADAFIAIEAKNKDKLGSANVVIFDLAKEIGLEKALNEQKPKLQKMLNNQEWDSLKNGISKIHQEFSKAIKTDIAGGNDYLVLADIGGWIEGTVAISNYLITTPNPSKDACSLLKQPGLPKFLVASLSEVKGKFPQKEELKENLLKLETLFSQQDDLSKQNFTQINTIAKKIVSQFN